MIKDVKHRVWAFDLEWVPDPLAGLLLYDVGTDVINPADVMDVMWERGGATEEDPTPFLKTALCRVVSVAALERRQQPDGSVKVNLMSLPRDPANSEETSEAHVVGTFLDAARHWRREPLPRRDDPCGGVALGWSQASRQ